MFFSGYIAAKRVREQPVADDTSGEAGRLSEDRPLQVGNETTISVVEKGIGTLKHD